MRARYNKKYKEISLDCGIPAYLKQENLKKWSREDEVRALINLRCRNLEKNNKYWLEESRRS